MRSIPLVYFETPDTEYLYRKIRAELISHFSFSIKNPLLQQESSAEQVPKRSLFVCAGAGAYPGRSTRWDDSYANFDLFYRLSKRTSFWTQHIYMVIHLCVLNSVKKRVYHPPNYQINDREERILAIPSSKVQRAAKYKTVFGSYFEVCQNDMSQNLVFWRFSMFSKRGVLKDKPRNEIWYAEVYKKRDLPPFWPFLRS